MTITKKSTKKVDKWGRIVYVFGYSQKLRRYRTWAKTSVLRITRIVARVYGNLSRKGHDRKKVWSEIAPHFLMLYPRLSEWRVNFNESQTPVQVGS